MKSETIPYLLTGLLLVAAAGCADPAADAPDALVQEAASVPVGETVETAGAAVYKLSEDSSIGFVGSKVTGSHEGGFSSFAGTVAVTGATPESASVEVVIDTTTLWADNEKLTGHLKSADFFDVESHPTATFRSTAITASEDGAYTLTGNLDLHGITRQISFPAAIEVSETGFSATAEFSLNRMDFAIEYPGKPNDLIREEVLIRLDLRSASADLAEAGEEVAAG